MSRGGWHQSEEVKARISANHMGHPVSPETRAKLSAMKIGVPVGIGHGFSPETRAKMSAARIGNNNCVGRRLSEETRAKIGACQKGRKMSVENRQALSKRLLGSHRSPESIAKGAAANWTGGKIAATRRANAKRRTLGFILLNMPFVGCEAHHVDNDQVINIPKALHRSIYHRQTDGRGMAKMNAIAYNFLFKQEIEAAMAAKERI